MAKEIIDFEGEDTLDAGKELEEGKNIYPTNVKVNKDTYSVYELKRQYEQRKTLILDPEFQREDVWTKKQKSELIESIIMGIPLPVMYFAEDKEGKLHVVDGKQRLTALFDYLNNKFSITSAPILLFLKGKKFKDLEPQYQARLEDYQLTIYVIKPQTPERVKLDIFDRINRGGTVLNKQEMRNALYQGKSTKLLKELAEMKCFKKATDNSISPKRMKDRYLILRFISFYLWKKGKINYEYKSDIDDFLREVMERINEMENNKIEEIKKVFIQAMENSYEILGENAFRIPSTGRKRPINMSLFESLSYLMSHPSVKENQEIIKEKVANLFKDEDFLNALTEKVDSTSSVKIRFSKMDKILEEIDAKKTYHQGL